MQSTLGKDSSSTHQNDAKALLELLKHDDKEVRKAARKALHKLRSRGIKIAETGEQRSWSQASTEDFRGSLQAFAGLDTRSVPSLASVIVSLPIENGHCQLWIVSLTADDHIFRFDNKYQTDGQRHRLLRNWQQKFSTSERALPLPWVFERILWARRNMMTKSRHVPAGVEKNLVRLNEVTEPIARPLSFLHGKLNSEQKINPASLAKFEAATIENLLKEIGMPAWPALFNLQGYAENMQKVQQKTALAKPPKAAEETEENSTPEPSEANKVSEEMINYLRTSEEATLVLQGPVANILDDVAIELWLQGRDQDAALLLALAEQLRASVQPASYAWLQAFFQQQNMAVIQAILQASNSRPFA